VSSAAAKFRSAGESELLQTRRPNKLEENLLGHFPFNRGMEGHYFKFRHGRSGIANSAQLRLEGDKNRFSHGGSGIAPEPPRAVSSVADKFRLAENYFKQEDLTS
ncbi:MAG: hypothetical protein LT105_07615, partial [Lentimicrobium sp.]|nr:hypothetical protein [Lentimicrobium sp.]